jgi:hypothetical protein
VSKNPEGSWIIDNPCIHRDDMIGVWLLTISAWTKLANEIPQLSLSASAGLDAASELAHVIGSLTSCFDGAGGEEDSDVIVEDSASEKLLEAALVESWRFRLFTCCSRSYN